MLKHDELKHLTHHYLVSFVILLINKKLMDNVYFLLHNIKDSNHVYYNNLFYILNQLNILQFQ